MGEMTNATYWELVKKAYPKFKEATANKTYQQFMSRGFESVDFSNAQILDDFFNLSLRIVLNQVNISHAKDIFETHDVGETYSTPFGGVLQRISVGTVKGVDPAYKNLENGGTVDPFVINKAECDERFFIQNFDYQGLVTIPDADLRRQIFASDYGMDEFIGGIMEGLKNGYTIQKYDNKMAVLNQIINSTKHPLQDSQKAEVKLSTVPTVAELTALYKTMYMMIGAMTNAPQTNAFNAGYFSSTQETSRIRVLIKQGLPAEMRFSVLSAAFNKEDLGLQAGVEIMEVPNFGGLEAYKEATFATPLYPVYNKLGAQIGWNTEEGQTDVEVENADVYWKDPNANVVCMIMDKGAIFTNVPGEEVAIEPIRNPRGKYNNYFLNAPRQTVCYDSNYNVVVIYNNPSAS